jgi:adenosylmethionine-8-amino-7-oxononanoate aminotransferase
MIHGAAGMVLQPPGWLTRLAAATRRAGALLVADEVATGVGRTGKWFAVEHEGVRPDLLCVAKGLSGGYLPVAATLATDAIHDSFSSIFSDGYLTTPGNDPSTDRAMIEDAGFVLERVPEAEPYAV